MLVLDIVFQPIAFTIVFFNCNRRGGVAVEDDFFGKNGTITGTACPKGLHGIFCKVRRTRFNIFPLYHFTAVTFFYLPFVPLSQLNFIVVFEAHCIHNSILFSRNAHLVHSRMLLDLTLLFVGLAPLKSFQLVLSMSQFEV